MNRKQDIANFVFANIIEGLLEVKAIKKITMLTATRDKVQKGNMNEAKGYDQVKQHFEDVKKMDRTKHIYLLRMVVCACDIYKWECVVDFFYMIYACTEFCLYN